MVAIGGDAAGLARLGLEVVVDQWPGEGPLGGLTTAVAWSPEPLVVVAACDQPWLDAATVVRLVGAHATGTAIVASVSSVDGVVQPLPGVYRRNLLPALVGSMDAGRRALKEALELGPISVVPLGDGRTVRDVDRVSDLPGRYDHADFSGDRSKEVDIPEIDVDELARRHQAGATLIDVRQPDEYEAGHVPGAVLIPLREVPERVDEVPAGGEVLVICKSGGRSRSASEFLRTQGIDAINVAGGTQAWIRSGHTVVGGDRPG